jgi:transposase-like protein
MTNLKITNLAKKHKPNTSWSREAKIQAVSQYLVLGNMALVSATTGIPHQLLRAWKQQPWWKETEVEVRATENLEMDNKLSKIVDKSLDAVLDRIENGEFVYNQKTGMMVRKSVTMKDAAKVSVDLLSKRELLRGNATERKETTQISVAEQLKELALEFAKWQKPQAKQQDVLDVETVEIIEQDEDDAIYEERETGLQEGSGSLYEQASSEEEACGTERSSGGDGESWESP